LIRKNVSVVLFVFLLATFASAQIPSGNVFFGYSHTSTNFAPGESTGLNGWDGSVEGKVLPLLGVVADLNGVYGSHNTSEYNFLFGPRLSFSIRKFRPFVHALIGIGHVSAGPSGFSTSNTSFADALGGGLDYHLIPLISWRIQLDALQTRFFSASQSNLRFCTGIAIHF
jgi:hypothetical protein